MHEMGLVDAVLRTVSDICEQEHVTHVTKITLEVGELSGVVPRFLRECFEAIIEDTPYEDTELGIDMVPGTLRCNDCRIEFPADVNNLMCPECFGRNLTPMDGRDFLIKEIETDDE